MSTANRYSETDPANPYAPGVETPQRIIEDFPTHPVLVGYAFWILGIFGAHRFYYGKPLTGLLWLLTGGLLLIGWIVDLFLIPAMSEEAQRRYTPGKTDYTVSWLLLTFLGVFGVHRFYMNKLGTGILYLLTGGLFFIGVMYDFATLNDQVDEVNRNDMRI